MAPSEAFRASPTEAFPLRHSSATRNASVNRPSIAVPHRCMTCAAQSHAQFIRATCCLRVNGPPRCSATNLRSRTDSSWCARSRYGPEGHIRARGHVRLLPVSFTRFPDSPRGAVPNSRSFSFPVSCKRSNAQIWTTFLVCTLPYRAARPAVTMAPTCAPIGCCAVAVLRCGDLRDRRSVHRTFL
jgi:hypothetical protein